MDPAGVVMASDAKGPTIPIELLQDGKARLFRVDVHAEDLAHPRGWAEQLIKSGLITRLLQDAWLEPRILCDEHRTKRAPQIYDGFMVRANGSYDGLAIGLSTLSFAHSPPSPLFHVIKVETTDMVCKVAILGPALFHPTRVSSNINTNFPSPIQKKNKLAAYFI